MLGVFLQSAMTHSDRVRAPHCQIARDLCLDSLNIAYDDGCLGDGGCLSLRDGLEAGLVEGVAEVVRHKDEVCDSEPVPREVCRAAPLREGVSDVSIEFGKVCLSGSYVGLRRLPASHINVALVGLGVVELV